MTSRSDRLLFWVKVYAASSASSWLCYAAAQIWAVPLWLDFVGSMVLGLQVGRIFARRYPR